MLYWNKLELCTILKPVKQLKLLYPYSQIRLHSNNLLKWGTLFWLPSWNTTIKLAKIGVKVCLILASCCCIRSFHLFSYMNYSNFIWTITFLRFSSFLTSQLPTPTFIITTKITIDLNNSTLDCYIHTHCLNMHLINWSAKSRSITCTLRYTIIQWADHN